MYEKRTRLVKEAFEPASLMHRDPQIYYSISRNSDPTETFTKGGGLDFGASQDAEKHPYHPHYLAEFIRY
jgi:hypothetical protein